TAPLSADYGTYYYSISINKESVRPWKILVPAAMKLPEAERSRTPEPPQSVMCENCIIRTNSNITSRYGSPAG
ncbi:hypothetical protein Tsubulata_028263, partial [Turnera subulata]